MFEKLTQSEELLFSTVRISSDIGTGTGFLFTFQANNLEVPVIVTNKHVVNGATRGEFVFTKGDGSGKPALGQTHKIQFNDFSRLWIGHPDSDVDLCIMGVARLLEELGKRAPVFGISLAEKDIPSQIELEEFDAIEDVVMIGYPSGMWDAVNNMPIVRRGITATHPAIDFEGNATGFIDIACYPGSSGSPVFGYKSGIKTNRDGGVSLLAGRNYRLLGIMAMSAYYDAQGKIIIVNLPTTTRPVASTQIFTNLGLMIKSRKLLDFLPIIEAELAKAK